MEPLLAAFSKGPLTLMAFDSIRIEADVRLNENTSPFISDQHRGLAKI